MPACVVGSSSRRASPSASTLKVGSRVPTATSLLSFWDSISHHERYGACTRNEPCVPGRAGLPDESIMRTAITGCVRPSAISVEASRTISARTAPPA